MESKTFCVLPWIHSCVRPDETIKPCCRFQNHDQKGLDITLDDVAEKGDSAMNNDIFNDIRQKMLNGEPVEGCVKCYQEEENKESLKPSMRLFLNQRFGSSINSNIDNKFQQIHYIEMSLDNICNLECRMCNSFFSTKLQKRDKYLQHYHSNQNTVHKKQEPNWEKYNSSDLSKLEYVKILGGEVFRTPNFEPFLDWLDSKTGLENIVVELSTNGTALPSGSLLDKMLRLKQINSNLSLDATHDVNDYQRQGSNWNTVLENGNKLSELFREQVYYPSIHTTQSIFTVPFFSQTLKDFEKLGWKYTVDFVYKPDEYNIQFAPPEVKQWLLESNKDHPKAYSLVNSQLKTDKYNKQVWENLGNQVTLLDYYYDKKLADYSPILAQHLGV